MQCTPNPQDPSPNAYEFPGKVVAFPSPQDIIKATHAVEERTGWLVNQTYNQWPRLIADVDVGHGHIIRTLAAYQVGQKFKIGDPIQAISRHRDPDSACHFIPWTIQPQLTSSLVREWSFEARNSGVDTHQSKRS